MIILRRPRAKKDIVEIATYLAAHGSEATAMRFQNSVELTLNAIHRMPGIGSPFTSRKLSLKKLRVFPVADFPKYCLFYLERSSAVIELVRVLHASRDLDPIFGNG